MRNLCLLALALTAAAQTIDPNPPMSESRRARIEEFRKKAAAVTARFEAHSFTGSDGHAMPYRLFRPAKLAPGRKYPLVFYLHGSGGSGADNQRQFSGGNQFGTHVWALDEHQARHPAFVLAPQSDRGWAGGAGETQALELLEKIARELPVDRARVYVTGQSMGGRGSWSMATRHPSLFAAVVPVCGRGDTSLAGALRSLPIWNFHGTADPTVPVTSSRQMIEAVRKAGGKPFHTEYEGVGHNSWEWAYSEPAMVDWIFSQKRPDRQK